MACIFALPHYAGWCHHLEPMESQVIRGIRHHVLPHLALQDFMSDRDVDIWRHVHLNNPIKCSRFRGVDNTRLISIPFDALTIKENRQCTILVSCDNCAHTWQLNTKVRRCTPLWRSIQLIRETMACKRLVMDQIKHGRLCVPLKTVHPVPNLANLAIKALPATEQRSIWDKTSQVPVCTDDLPHQEYRRMSLSLERVSDNGRSKKRKEDRVCLVVHFQAYTKRRCTE